MTYSRGYITNGREQASEMKSHAAVAKIEYVSLDLHVRMEQNHPESDN